GLDPRRRQMINDPSDKRRLGANHDEIDRHDLAKARDHEMIGQIEHDGLPQAGHARIARRDEKRFQQRTFRERDGEGMLAAARTEKKNIHDGPRYSGPRPGESHSSIEVTGGWR